MLINKPAWLASDLQLLDALLLATGGEGATTLQDVLLMADALDGTVFTLQELQQGLEKLIAVGIVTLQKNKLALTPLFLEGYEKLTEQENGFPESEALLQLLQQYTLEPRKLEAVRQEELKKYNLKKHYQQYQEQFG